MRSEPPGSPEAFAPKKHTMVGLALLAACASTFCATASAGGLLTNTITCVAGSCCKALRPASIISPPTSSFRSRPPVPMPWLRPTPFFASSVLTSCRPVPAAETRPTGPAGTTLAKPSAAPFKMAVPAPGPISSKPWATAYCFNAISSASETLSLKSSTCKP